MKNIFSTLLASLWLGHISVLSRSLGSAQALTEKRQLACGDPALAETYYEAYSDKLGAHVINSQAAFVSEDSKGDGPWAISGPSFLAWSSPGQPGTVPFYNLYNPKTSDFVYSLAVNGKAPALSGYNSPYIILYVYPTQICGSVPLYGASTTGDHWYTTDLAQRDKLVKNFGWTAEGVVAYVLPLQ